MNEIKFTYRCFLKQSINDFLIKKGYSSNNIFYLIKNKKVFVNDKAIKDKNEKVNFFEKINVTLLNETNTLLAYEYDLDTVYEDEYILIVNKPKNMEVEPSIKNNQTTLANAVINYFNKKGIKSKVHLVNRLDKLTTGLVIIAKNQYIHNLFKKVKIEKRYLALVEGKTKNRQTIIIKIDKVEGQIKRVISENGKLCTTKYKLLKYFNNRSLVDIKLLTGRTHQIRLSFSYIDHPLVGDPIYGKKEEDMYLDAYYLNFIHPILKKKIKIKKDNLNT